MLRKISEGNSPRSGPNSASNWAKVVDATNHYLLTKSSGEKLPQQKPHFNWHTQAMVANETGYDLRCGEVVEFSGFLPADVNNDNLLFSGATPDLTNTGWGITLEEIAHNADPRYCGRCAIVGLAAAYVNVTNTNHTYAKLVSGSRVLESAASGPVQIFHKPSGTGEKLCAVLIGAPSLKVYLGKTSGALDKGTSGPVIRHVGGAEVPYDPEIEDTVKNLYVDLDGAKWVHYVDVDGTLYAIAGECG